MYFSFTLISSSGKGLSLFYKYIVFTLNCSVYMCFCCWFFIWLFFGHIILFWFRYQSSNYNLRIENISSLMFYIHLNRLNWRKKKKHFNGQPLLTFDEWRRILYNHIRSRNICDREKWNWMRKNRNISWRIFK